MLKYVAVFVVAALGLVAFAGAAPQSQPPRGNSSTTNRPPTTARPNPSSSSASPSIIYGTPAEQGEIPFQADLFSVRNGSEFGFGCGGSLIAPNWILTAAHCLPDTDGTQVSLGSVSQLDMPYSEWSYERYPHEDYDDVTTVNDIALIKLPRPAPIDGQNIAVVQMAPRNYGSLEGETARASGFGLTSNDGQGSEVLLKVNLLVSSLQDCNSYYGGIDDRQICTVYLTREGESTCEGDSGGPLSYEDPSGSTILVGITSFGSDAGCDANVPSVYTRVATFQDWIERTMAANP